MVLCYKINPATRKNQEETLAIVMEVVMEEGRERNPPLLNLITTKTKRIIMQREVKRVDYPTLVTIKITTTCPHLLLLFLKQQQQQQPIPSPNLPRSLSLMKQEDQEEQGDQENHIRLLFPSHQSHI
jgi:hypothetical protein